MWCFVKQRDGVPIPWSVGWLCSCKAVTRLLPGLPTYRAPEKAFSIDHVGGTWVSDLWSLHEQCCDSIAAFHGVNAGDKCSTYSSLKTVLSSGIFGASSAGHSCKAFMLPQLRDVANVENISAVT